MSTLNRLFDPFRSAAAAFFKHDLAVRREGEVVKLVLEERPRPGQPRRPTRAEMIERKEKEELTQIRAELAALLNELPETRQTMRHLVFVEKALAKKGLRALHKVPLDVLQRALEQLEGLVVNWTPVGLANLRSKMAVAVIDREHMDEDEGDAYRTSAIVDASPARAHPEPAAPVRSEEEALAAAYAALGSAGPDSVIVVQSEPGSRSAPALRPQAAAAAASTADDEAALAAAYAALATAAPQGVEMQPELGTRSARVVTRFQNSTLTEEPLPDLKIRELHA